MRVSLKAGAVSFCWWVVCVWLFFGVGLGLVVWSFTKGLSCFECLLESVGAICLCLCGVFFELMHVSVVGFQDVEEAMDVRSGSRIFDPFLVFRVDAYFV